MSKGRELQNNPSKKLKGSKEFESSTETNKVSLQVPEE